MITGSTTWVSRAGEGRRFYKVPDLSPLADLQKVITGRWSDVRLPTLPPTLTAPRPPLPPLSPSHRPPTRLSVPSLQSKVQSQRELLSGRGRAGRLSDRRDTLVMQRVSESRWWPFYPYGFPTPVLFYLVLHTQLRTPSPPGECSRPTLAGLDRN